MKKDRVDVGQGWSHRCSDPVEINGNIMRETFRIKEFHGLLEEFCRLTHMGVVLADPDGYCLGVWGKQEICTDFYRKDAEAQQQCQSRSFGAQDWENKAFQVKTCPHGLQSMMAPLKVDHHMIGILILGPFFWAHEPVEEEEFFFQAREKGFFKEEYIRAFRAIPRWSQKTMQGIMEVGVHLFVTMYKGGAELARLKVQYADQAQKMQTLQAGELTFRSLVENIRVGICRSRAEEDGAFILTNEAFRNFLGYSIQELSIMKAPDIYWDQKEYGILLQLLREKGSLVGKDIQFKRRDGASIWGTVTARLLQVGDELFLDSTVEDCTERRRAEQSLKRQKEWLEALFKNSNDAIVLADKHHRVVDINQPFEELFQYRLEEIKGMDIDSVLERGKRGTVNRNLTEKLLAGETVETEGTRFNRDGQPIDVLIRGVPVLIDGKMAGGYAIYADITQRKKAQEKIRYLSVHDRATGLYNRAFLEEEMRRLDTPRQLPLSIIIADINGLKMVNDAYGYKLGDTLINTAVEVLKNSCRHEDILARWGGDEFVLLLPQTRAHEARAICERISKGLQTRTVQGVPVLMALGQGSKEKEGESLARVLQDAEDEMFRKKMMESQQCREAIVHAFLKFLGKKSHEDEGHGHRMQEMGEKLGNIVPLWAREKERLSLVLEVHDVGLVAVEEKILKKQGPLNREEWEEIKSHPELGCRIALSTEKYAPVAREILSHHEWWDGSGYPQGQKGEDIPYLSRIVAVLEAYDALTNHRSYRRAPGKERAIEELEKGKGRQFDPSLIDVFVKILNG